MDIVITIASKVAELLVEPILRQIGYVISYKDNIQKLEDQLKELKGVRERVKHSEEAAKRKGEEIESDVVNWKTGADKATEVVEKLLEENRSRGNNMCLMGWCPDLKTRYRLSRKAKKQLRVIVEFQGKAKFGGEVSYRTATHGMGPGTDYEVFKSRVSVLNKITEALRDDRVKLVGVYGMGGSGKTTLVKKIAEKVKEDGMFAVVTFADITQTPDVEKIQEELAVWLDFEFDVENIDVRANRLRDRLKKEKKVLVILDNIWSRIELQKIGIVLGPDHKGCKVLMTSRSQNVLWRDIVTEKDFIFQLDGLPFDAWNLFEKMVDGNAFKDPTVRDVAIEVAKRCAGLPVLLFAVGRALKDADLYAWKASLKKLQRFDNAEMDEQVNSAVELSYNFLKSDEIKSLFLLCGQLSPHNIYISDLVKYLLGLRLFKTCRTLEETTNRVHNLVNGLIGSSLLLEGNDKERVKMHDVFYSFARSVESKEYHVFSVEYNGVLDEWPQNEEIKQFTAISLPYCKFPNLPEVFECPELKSFILYGSDPSQRIPDKFFTGMKELKVMDISDMHLSPLPSSIQALQNLQTLCLDRCVLDNLALIGELKKLQVISLIGSNIVKAARRNREADTPATSRFERLLETKSDSTRCPAALDPIGGPVHGKLPSTVGG